MYISSVALRDGISRSKVIFLEKDVNLSNFTTRSFGKFYFKNYCFENDIKD